MAALQGAPALVQLRGRDVNAKHASPDTPSAQHLRDHKALLQGLDFLGKTEGVVLLQECGECVMAIDVLLVYRAGLELETRPIQDGCSIGTKSSAQVFHSRDLLLWIHNTH